MSVDYEDPTTVNSTAHLIPTNGLKAVRINYPPNPILESVKNELIDECNNYLYERCGFISEDWEVWRVPNSHNFAKRNFFMSAEDVGPVFDEIYNIKQSSIIAIWHTHPNGVPWPSPRDIRGWPNQLLGWRYLVVIHNEVIEWELVKNDTPNTKRPF